LKNSHIETTLLGDTFKRGKNIKESKVSIITNAMRMITSRGEEQGCDHGGAHRGLLESRDLRGYFLYIHFIIVHSIV